MSPAPTTRQERLERAEAQGCVGARAGGRHSAATWWGGWPFRVVWTLVAGLVAYEWLSIVSRQQRHRRWHRSRACGVCCSDFRRQALPALAGVARCAALMWSCADAAGSRIVWRSRPAVSPMRWPSRWSRQPCGRFPISVLRSSSGALRRSGFTDIAAYFTGRKLGGPKLMPRFSPKKTWSGAIGGTIAGTLGGYAVWALTPQAATVVGPGLVIAASLAASVVSQAGDLFESAIKRRFGTKDSSHLIPGHGGFLDRLDGYWAVLVFAGLLLFCLVRDRRASEPGR
jgi:phosphatidate cytidylyltransferase